LRGRQAPTLTVRAHARPKRGSQVARVNHGPTRSVKRAKGSASVVRRQIQIAHPVLLQGPSVPATTPARASQSRWAASARSTKDSQQAPLKRTTHARHATVASSMRSTMRNPASHGQPRNVRPGMATRPAQQGPTPRVPRVTKTKSTLQTMIRRSVRLIRLPRALPGP